MTDLTDESPYWFPELTDDAWVARMRADYPNETAGMDDEEVRDYFADGWKYADTWDHLGDARDSYEKLADDYFALIARLRAAESKVSELLSDAADVADDMTELRRELRAAEARAEAAEKDAERYRALREYALMFYPSAEGSDDFDACLIVTGYGQTKSDDVVDKAVDTHIVGRAASGKEEGK